MKIAMVGSGYVGLVSGACFADFGHDVVCIDKDQAKIDRLLRAGAAPQDAVFISRAPREKGGPIYKAYQDVIKELVNKPNTRLIPANLDRIAMQKAIVEPQAIH